MTWVSVTVTSFAGDGHSGYVPITMHGSETRNPLLVGRAHSFGARFLPLTAAALSPQISGGQDGASESDPPMLAE
jgi:hypothetical protein